MRVVVTGSAGMIGSVLSESLLEGGHEVIPVDRRPNEWSDSLEAITRRIDLLHDPRDYDLPLTGVDAVVHCAANARVHDLVLHPEQARENFDSCFNALEYARRTGAHFVFTSSREVYGNQGLGRYGEDDVDAEAIESPYAATKLAGEQLIRSYGRVYGQPFTIVRLSNVYGRNDLSDRFVPIAVQHALTGHELPIYGREKRLDFTYIDDTIGGLNAVLARLDSANGEVFNLATGSASTLEEVATRIASLLERDLPLSFEQTRPGEVISYEADISRACDRLDYRPRYALDEGLALAIEWYMARFTPREQHKPAHAAAHLRSGGARTDDQDADRAEKGS